MATSKLPSDFPAGLLTLVEPLLPYLFAPRQDVVEVSINGENDLWIEYANGEYIREKAIGLDYRWAVDLCNALKNLFNRAFDEHRWPTISAPIPGGHRLMAVLGAATRNKIAISIRVAREVKFKLDDFGLGHGQIVKGGRAYAALNYDSGHPIGSSEDLIACYQRGFPILVVGGTNMGKTRFLDALMRFTPATDRVIAIEDVQELSPPVKNFVGLLADSSNTGVRMTATDLIKPVLRMNPTRVITGEIQPDNSEVNFRMINTGHAGWVATIHGDSPLDGLAAWHQNLTIEKSLDQANAMLPTLVRKLARIVQLGDTDIGRRQVVEIAKPADLGWTELLGK